MKALPGMSVAISRSGAGIGNAITDANGAFTIDVTPGGSLGLFAQGVCDTDPVDLCNDELNYNATESETVDVAPGETKSFDPRARRGYHLRITNPQQNVTVAPGATFQVQLACHLWNRAGLPGGVPRIMVGVDGDADASDVVMVGVANVHPGTTGTTSMTITAPMATKSYGVYALLVVAAGHLPADSVYEASFQVARTRQYIRLFTLTVQ